MKKRWPRPKLVIKLLAIIVCLPVLFLIFLHTPPGERFVFQQLRIYLHNRSGIDLTASEFNLNVFKGTLNLEKVAIQSAAAPDMPPLFDASSIHVELSILDAIRRRTIEKLEIKAPQILYYVDQNGQTNLPETETSSGEAPDLLINHATVTDGDFKLHNLQRNVFLQVPISRLSVEGDRSTRSHYIAFDSRKNAIINYGDRTIPINSVKFSGSLQKTALQIDSAQIAGVNSTVSINGMIQNFTQPAIDLQFTPILDLDQITRTTGLKEKIQGNVTGTVKLSGGLNRIQIEAQLKSPNFTAVNYRRTKFEIKTHAEWVPDAGRLTIRDFDLSSPRGTLSGSAEFFPGQDVAENSLRVKMRDLDLSPLWAHLKPPFDLASRSTGSVTLRWKGRFAPSKITGDASLNLTASLADPEPRVLPVSGTMVARMQSDRILGNVKSFAVLGTNVNGSFSLRSFKEVKGSFIGDSSNIDVLSAQISRFLGNPESSIVPFKISGPVQFHTQISGSLKQPEIIAFVDTPDLQAAGLKNLQAQTNATIRDSKIEFQSTIGLPQDSIVRTRGTLEFGGPDLILNLDANTDRLPMTALFSSLESRIPVTGALKATLNVYGPVDNLRGHASIAGNKLSIYGEQAGHMDMDLQLSGGKTLSAKFQLFREPQNPDRNFLDARFTYEMNSEQFQFQANGENLAIKRTILPNEIPVEGTLQLQASGTGTLKQPSIDLTLESDNLQIRQNPVGPFSVIAALRNDRLTIETLISNYNIASTVDIVNREPYPFEGELRATNSDLSHLGFKGASGQPVTGKADAVLKGSGNLKDLARSNLLAHINTLQLQAGDLEVHIQDAIQMEYRDNSIKLISPVTIVSGNSKLEITGTAPLRQNAPEGSLQFKGQLDLSQASGFVPIPDGFAANGIMNLDFALEGTTQKISSAGSITLDGGVVQLPKIPVPLTDVALRAIVREGTLVLQRVNALWGEGKIALTGELPFGLLPQNIPIQFPRKKGPAHFTIDMTDLKPEATGIFPQGISGHISLHASGQATRLDPRTLSAQIQFSDLGFRVNAVDFDQRESSTIFIRDGIASISRLSLIGAKTNLEVGGTVGLLPDGPLDLRLFGDIDTAFLTSTSRDLKAAGKMQVQVLVAGYRNAPVLSGIASMSDGKLTLRKPRVVADSLSVILSFSPDEITVREFSGTLNGGSVDLKGTIGYRDGTLNDFNLKAEIQDFFLNYPEGLKSVSDGNLTITSSDNSILIGGSMRARESSYREPIVVGGQLLSYLKSQQVVQAGQESDPLLERIRLNIALRTTTPLLVQNNIANIDAAGNLRLVGTYYEPSMTGRITLDEGGEIILNQQKYYIRQGAITLANQTYIEPELNIRAQTKVDTYNITLQLTGTPERLNTTLSSEPMLAEADILSLLLTGKTASETQTPDVVRTQALSLLAGEAGEELTRGARQALHLSTFRIDPGLITSESDPGSRITLGEDLTRDLSLAYSMNLVNGGDQIWAAQYDITRGLSTQATRQQDNTYRFEFRHDLRLGGSSGRRASRKPQAPKLKIGSINVQGGSPFTDKTVLDKFKVKPGDKYDFPKVRKGLDYLREFFADQKHLEADIRMQRETKQNTINLKLNINPGPEVDFSYDGFPLSENVKKKVRETWTDGVFETERIDDAVIAIRRHLIRAGYLQCEVTYTIETENNQKRVHFNISPGARYARIPVTFPGASEIKAIELNRAMDLADLKLNIYADPQSVVDYLERYYRERGYLQAHVDLPRLNLDPKTGGGEAVIPVQEGPLFLIGDLEFIGNHAFDYDQIWSVIPTSSGSSYDPNTLRDSVKAIENLYHSKGYNDVTVTFRVAQDSESATANLAFQITERKQSIIRDIVIEGNRNTSQDFVKRQLDFQIGDANNLANINASRKRLYASGVYTSVDFLTEEIPASEPDTQKKDVRIRIRLREIQPYRLQYGMFYDTERGPGGLIEVQNLNFLGEATNLGLRLRYDSDLKEARLYFNQPFITKIHVKMDASAFVQRETREAFSATRVGFSIIRRKELPREYRFDYGYRYDHVRWNGLPPDPTIFQASVPVSRLIATISRDTRDSILDATRGEFSSHSLEYGPSWLGSEIGFARYYGQYFRYVPLDKLLKLSRKDQREQPVQPRLVYAGALRLGLTGAFEGQSIPSPERFFAGGGTTMRGFQQDRLGPLEEVFISDTEKVLRPKGGEALFLLNNEIRFPIVGFLQGVGFVDIGNVFPTLSNIRWDLRKSAGAGLRIKIKYVPLRFDYGFKLDRRPGESGSEFFFSIGQAF